MGSQSELPRNLSKPPPHLLAWKFGEWRTGAWDALNLEGQFGPEVTFATKIAEEIYKPRKQKFGIVKVAKIMTSLAKDWSLSNYKDLIKDQDKLHKLFSESPRWSEKTDKEFEPFLFAQLVDSAQKAMNSKECAGGRCQIKALVWAQGESDAMVEEFADQYEATFMKMVGILRRELHAYDMKVVVAQVSPELNPRTFPATKRMIWAEHNMVRKQGPKRGVLAYAHGLAKLSDNLHYNTAGQMDLGNRLADAYLKIADK